MTVLSCFPYLDTQKLWKNIIKKLLKNVFSKKIVDLVLLAGSSEVTLATKKKSDIIYGCSLIVCVV